MEVSGEIHASAALLPVKKSPYSWNRKLYGSQRRYGRFGKYKNPFLLPGIHPESSSPYPSQCNGYAIAAPYYSKIILILGVPLYA
jgi:hypothetical protein